MYSKDKLCTTGNTQHLALLIHRMPYTVSYTHLDVYKRQVDILCQFYPENEYVLYAPKKRENKRLDKLTDVYMRQMQHEPIP